MNLDLLSDIALVLSGMVVFVLPVGLLVLSQIKRERRKSQVERRLSSVV